MAGIFGDCGLGAAAASGPLTNINIPSVETFFGTTIAPGISNLEQQVGQLAPTVPQTAVATGEDAIRLAQQQLQRAEQAVARPGIPSWVWWVGGGLLAYWLLFRRGR